MVLMFFLLWHPTCNYVGTFWLGYVSTHLSSLNLPKSRLFGCEKLLLCRSFLYLEVLVSKLQGANHLTVPVKLAIS